MNTFQCKPEDFIKLVESKKPVLTVAQLLAFSPRMNPAYASVFVEEVNKSSINTPLRVAHFLAQTGHESALHTVVRENLNYSYEALGVHVFTKYFTTPAIRQEYARKPERIASRAYANRMGNGNEASGEGWKYRGRGYIQLTGKNNYRAYSSAKYGDERLIDKPELAEAAYDAICSSIWYWETNKLNAWADKDDVLAVSRGVNNGSPTSTGTPHGLQDRRDKLASAKKALKIT